LTSVSVVAVALIIALFTRAQHQRRLESDLRTATDAAATAGREVNSLRSAHQSFADNLKSDDVATVLKNRISYTVDAVNDVGHGPESAAVTITVPKRENAKPRRIEVNE